MRCSFLMAAVSTCLLGLSAMAAEMVDNPAYTNWAKYKPGTSITYSNEMQMQGMNMKTEMTQKLSTLDAEKAVVEMKMKSSGMDMPAQMMTIPAKVEKVEAKPGLPPGMKGEVKDLGKEKLSVAGKTIECQVVQFTSEQEGQKISGKSWTSPDVPGTIVKTETNLPGDTGGKNTMLLTAMDLME